MFCGKIGRRTTKKLIDVAIVLLIISSTSLIFMLYFVPFSLVFSEDFLFLFSFLVLR